MSEEEKDKAEGATQTVHIQLGWQPPKLEAQQQAQPPQPPQLRPVAQQIPAPSNNADSGGEEHGES